MIIILLLTPLGLPMVPLVPTFRPVVTLAPKVPLATEKRSGFYGYNGTIGGISNARMVCSVIFSSLGHPESCVALMMALMLS